MTDYESPSLQRKPKRSDLTRANDTDFARVERSAEFQRPAVSGQEMVQAHLKERSRKATRRKWTGGLMIVFGLTTLLGSCPFYALSLIPGQSIAAGLVIMIAGLGIIAGGGALLAWKPRLKDTNEAMIVALKHGNRLTTSRLALEMNISFEKADKIIQELVRNGIAEIDLDAKDPDHTIVYRIKGL
ncbi:MAG: hypothetical protein FJY85_12485 [Deltaproteobacteria bacterium]|nr:hypothetical protein [Deltaproteobacteria bacterium]